MSANETTGNNGNFDVANHLDGILLGRIQTGDQNALSSLYDSRAGLVYSIILNVVRNAEDAEEVTQAVFLRIWERAQSFDPNRGSVLVWIVTIARRLAIDRTRSKHHRSQKVTVELEPEVTSKAGQAAVQSEAGRESEQIALGMVVGRALKKLERLSSDQRQVIELAYYGGLSHAEIAEQIATPLGTVKSRLRAAISQLRDILDTEA
ncbi:sigma-70 family RNA polymerase sigma factor [bacterium AH-315-J21]|nr:sigma-70 family RNA polymerase sigma factor [bacterium AH-315-J21]